ncbi:MULTISPECIES: DUF3310 domain-containing protein [Streptomyces]
MSFTVGDWVTINKSSNLPSYYEGKTGCIVRPCPPPALYEWVVKFEGDGELAFNSCEMELSYAEELDHIEEPESEPAVTEDQVSFETWGGDVISVRPVDAVKHPSHYTAHPSGVECIDIVKHMSFCLGSAIKYVWRADLKHDDGGIQDLRKAIQNIEFEIKKREAAA